MSEWKTDGTMLISDNLLCAVLLYLKVRTHDLAEIIWQCRKKCMNKKEQRETCGSSESYCYRLDEMVSIVDQGHT